MRSTSPSGAEALLRNAASALESFRFGARQTLAAWPVLMGRALFYLVAMVVLSALWNKVASARLPHTLAGALPPEGLTLYVGVTEWITLSVAAIHLRLEDDIRSGALEPHLLRPKPYLLQKVSEQMGNSLMRLAGIGLAAVLALVFTGHALPSASAFVYAAILGVLGAWLGVLLFTLVGLCAFWIRRVLPPYLIVQKMMFILGGLFAPISLYPVWLYRFAAATPFAAQTYFAGQQMIAPSGGQFLGALALQLVWLAILAGLTAGAWTIGIRRVLRQGI